MFFFHLAGKGKLVTNGDLPTLWMPCRVEVAGYYIGFQSFQVHTGCGHTIPFERALFAGARESHCDDG